MIRKALFAIQSIGIQSTLKTLFYSLRRDRLEKSLRPAPPSPAASPGKLQWTEILPAGAKLSFEDGFALEVVVIFPGVVRFTWTPGQIMPPYALATQENEPGEFILEQLSTGVRLITENLACEMAQDGTVTFSSDKGLLKTFYPPKRQGTKWELRASLYPEEVVYGLGERAGHLNLRGGQYQFWNTDPNGSYGPGQDPLYLGIPTLLGMTAQGGYLVFHENAARGEIRIDASDNPDACVQVSFERGALRTYFIARDPAESLANYTRLTGRAPLPPRWALGYHHCKWGHKTEAQIRAVADGFRDHRLPLDVIHLDIDYMRGFRVFTIDENRFPDMLKLSQDLAERGIHLVTILDPGVKADPAYDIFQEGKTKNLFCTLPGGGLAYGQVWPGECAFPDFTHPATRRWWGSLYPRLLEQGIQGFWHDMNEPSAFAAWGNPTLPLPTRHNLDGNPGNHLEAHNLYGLLMNQAGYDGLRQARPNQRPWFLTRSGWAGIQRYAWKWTADIESSWAALRLTIIQLLGLGLSGVPFTGSDIGGFSGNPDPELLTRWYQMAAFTPFFRCHAAVMVPPREPWLYDENTLAAIRQSLETRQRLIPYLYTLAWETSQTGAPLVRPLFWHHPSLASLWEVEDAFYLGESLLVAPVLEPKQAEREVILPPGMWYDFWSGLPIAETMDSIGLPTHLVVSTMPDRIPVFARAGSLVPLAREGEIEMAQFPDQDGKASGILYEDAGDGYGPYRLTHYTLSPSGTILSHTATGSYTA